jgi:hypothetical protein
MWNFHIFFSTDKASSAEADALSGILEFTVVLNSTVMLNSEQNKPYTERAYLLPYVFIIDNII